VERRKAILELIVQDGRAVVAQLSEKFSVTEETVRRDLEELERRGLILRTHGGAVSIDEALPDLSAEVRETVNSAGKKAIAKQAAKSIKQGDTLFFDASTSVYFLANEIKEMTNITIITNSLRIINLLSANEGIKLICVGGELSDNNKSFTSSSTQNYIRNNLFADKCFISCAAVTAKGELLESREEEAAVKKAMAESSKNLFLLCDKTKLGRARLYKIRALQSTDTLFTDVDKTNHTINELKEIGLKIIFESEEKK
jgi:DeoR/GlpR family transcriptional regulator of sugar metabolism